jgi:hypothetical protein
MRWPFSRLRTQHVVVAVVFDPARGKFLVVFNPRWGGYTFPMRRLRARGASDAYRERQWAEEEARAALRGDLGPDLGESTDAHWMDRIEVRRRSGRTDAETRYVYDIVTVLLKGPLPDGPFASPFGFLSADEIRDSDPDEPGPNPRVVTWTTWQVLTRLLDNQHVAAAVVRRRVGGRRQYLMTYNRYRQWFFPARRMGDLVPSDRLVVYEFKLDAEYLGRIQRGHETVVELEQTTPHLGPRTYVFHLHPTDFPDEDLTAAGNRLEAALDAAGVSFAWIDEGRLQPRLAPDLSPTLLGLAPAVLAMT